MPWSPWPASRGAALGSAWVVRRWSRRPGWDGRHRLALAGGAAATYATWFGPSQAAEAGTGPAEAAWGAVVFGLAVAALVVLAALRQRRLAVDTLGIVRDVLQVILARKACDNVTDYPAVVHSRRA